jgi:hypothetical protein
LADQRLAITAEMVDRRTHVVEHPLQLALARFHSPRDGDRGPQLAWNLSFWTDAPVTGVGDRRFQAQDAGAGRRVFR